MRTTQLGNSLRKDLAATLVIKREVIKHRSQPIECKPDTGRRRENALHRVELSFKLRLMNENAVIEYRLKAIALNFELGLVLF